MHIETPPDIGESVWAGDAS